MAQAFAEAYNKLSWKAIYVSPLYRTRETVRPLCEKVGVPMQLREGLQEIGYGQWEGMHPNDIDRSYHDLYVKWLTDPAWNAPPEGERGIDIARRSSQVLQEIQETHKTGNILIVSHKATIRIMLCGLLGIDIKYYRDRFLMPVAAVSLVELTATGPLIHFIGDRSHLNSYLRALPST